MAKTKVKKPQAAGASLADNAAYGIEGIALPAPAPKKKKGK
jgi:hypothetical protein